MLRLNRKGLVALIFAFSAVWHALVTLAPPERPPPKGTTGRDFASYYYAAKLAVAGEDPYDKGALADAAMADGTRKKVHPFLYPPPFLLSVVWAPSLELMEAFDVWFWINELLLAVAVVVLFLHLRPLGEAAGPALALAVALSFGVAYSHELGQANFGVLALIAGALHQERSRPWLAGILLGTACMWKMSPALLVLWWMLRRQWVGVVAACLWAVVLSVAVLPWLSVEHQLGFYRDVLPTFGSGDYNGLTIQIGMFGNYSVPNVLDQLWPGNGERLSTTARRASGVISLGLLGGLGALFARPTDDALQRAAQASAVMVVMVAMPVYTYEHHLVFALPALVVATVAVSRGAMGMGGALALAPCWAVWLAPAPHVRELAQEILGAGTVGAWLIEESKLLMLLVLLGLNAWLGHAPRPGHEGFRPESAP